MNKIILSVVLLFCIGGVFASSVSVWQGQYYTGTTFNSGTYTFNFTVYDAETGGSACFSNTTSLTTGHWGQWRTEQSPWDSCDNASKEYFLNINIAGSDQTPRRRLTVSDFLRRDVSGVQDGNLVVNDNVTADYYFGNGSFLVGINGTGDITSVHGDNIYIYNGSGSGDVVLVFNETKLNATIDDRGAGGDNSSWNESYADGKYILQSEEGNLDVNSSIYSNSTTWWASVSSWLSGWFVNDGGVLEFNESKLNESIDSKIDDIPDVGWLNDSFSTNTSLNVIVGGNITTSNYGFFGEIGSFLSRVAKLWVVDINASGDVSIGENLQVGQNVSAGWFNGLFNWFIEDNSSGFLSFNGSALAFNESQLDSEIDSGIAASQVLYSPNSIETIVGTLDGGNLTSIESINDGDTYNVSETTSAPGFVIVVNFSDVEIFNQIYLEEYYTGKSGHTIEIQLYNFNDSTYDSFGSFSNQVDFNFHSLEVLAYQDYVNDSNVSLRIYHVDSGNQNHDLFIDYVALKYDSAGVVITDHGSLGGLDSDDHLQYLRTDGARVMTGNLNASVYNITSVYIFANGSQLTDVCLSNGTNCLSAGDNSSWNESYADGKYMNLSGGNADQDINVAPYNFEAGNATFTQKITFAFGDVIDNIVNTWIRVSGGLNVTQGLTVGGDADVGGNVTTEGILLEHDPVNHRIYDNSTCVIIRGDTSTMYIC
ncbi:hypothetical protein KAT36_02425 [Candidatus Pacearchaeota archaeon]|nr:hypothetical protein [Candidatus Pacearchaeota archaeon]